MHNKKGGPKTMNKIATRQTTIINPNGLNLLMMRLLCMEAKKYLLHNIYCICERQGDSIEADVKDYPDLMKLATVKRFNLKGSTLKIIVAGPEPEEVAAYLLVKLNEYQVEDHSDTKQYAV